MKEKTKVIEFVHGLPMGGAETLVKEYCLGIDKSCFNLLLLCLYNFNSPWDELIAQNNIPVIYIYDRKPKTILEKIQHKIMLKYKVRKAIREFDPDVIHYHMNLSSLIRFSHVKKSVKLFLMVHTEPKSMWSKETLYRRRDFSSVKFLVRHNNIYFIVLHEKMKQEISELFKTEKVLILNNGIDFTRYKCSFNRDEYRRKLGIPVDAFLIGHVGRFSEEKNHEFLLKIFEAVKKKNKDAYLLMVGDGDEKSCIQSYILDNGLAQCAKILSNRSDVPEIMRCFDFFIFPSLYEGLGIVVVEAQYAGIPCLVSSAVPRYVSYSNLVNFKSLNDTPEEWAAFLLDYKQNDVRYINPEQWDMKQVIIRLQNIFSGKVFS